MYRLTEEHRPERIRSTQEYRQIWDNLLTSTQHDWDEKESTILRKLVHQHNGLNWPDIANKLNVCLSYIVWIIISNLSDNVYISLHSILFIIIANLSDIEYFTMYRQRQD